jgi:hypothetical protein
MVKKPTSIVYPPAVAERLQELIKHNGITGSQVVRQLIMAAPDQLPTYSVVIRSLFPLIITGDSWEGEFTGTVQVYFPPPTGREKIAALTNIYQLRETTFDDFLTKFGV